MSDTTDGPTPYHVTYSADVRKRLRALAAVTRDRGDGERFLTALQDFDRRLRIYPQFGDPLIDLVAVTGQIRLGVVPPLAMRYGVVEERRLVLVAAPPVLMPRRGAG